MPWTRKEDTSRVAQSPGAATLGDRAREGSEIDVFVSYSHIDNAPLVPGEDGWITSLHHALQVRLRQLIGGEVRIWRDPKLDGNDYFGDTLIDKISRSAVMVSVLSPRYVHSEWCRREVETFARCCERNLREELRHKSRIFKVTKTPVRHEQQPAELQGLLGYEFFEIAADNQRPREFRQDAGSHKDMRYWDKLEDLAFEVAELLTALRSGEAETDAAADKPAIYLATTSSDLTSEYDLMRRELRQRGHLVLPDRPLPTIATELREAVAGYLVRSSLALHLVGRRYGLVPEGSERSLVELQNELAAASAGKRGFPRVIWMPPSLEPEDARQREFIHRLETDSTAQANADLLHTELGELKQVVLKLCQPAGPELIGDFGSGVPSDIYLMYAPEDFDAVAPLEDALFDAGYELLTPLIDAEGREDPEEHRANLSECEAALVFYANASEHWFRDRLRELEQTPSGIARGVYVGAPETPRKLRFRTRRATVMKEFGRFDPADLQPFFAELTRSATEPGR